MLRIILVAAVLLINLKYSLKGPFYVLLFYLWLAYFRPEEWLWSNVLSGLNLSFFVGLGLVLSLVFSGRMRFNAHAAILTLFAAIAIVATLTSPISAHSGGFLVEFLKTLAVTYAITILVDSEARFRVTLAVVAFSLGLEGSKQGWAQLFRNPGGRNMNGWPMLGDNNGVAVGMLMLTALLIALATSSTRWRERVVLIPFTIGVVYRAISTYSRGAFLSCAGLGVLYVLRARNILLAGLMAGVIAGGLFSTLPDEYWARMGTVKTAAEDSEVGRIYFWRVATDIAADYPLGVGVNSYSAMYNAYDRTHGMYGPSRSVHSVWFGLLAELGYAGLGLFLFVLLRATLQMWHIQRRFPARGERPPLRAYATGIEAALLVFSVGGTFIPFQYKELIWHTIGLSMALHQVAKDPGPAPDAAHT